MTEQADSSIAQAIEPLIAEMKQLPGGLLPLLHSIQDALGFIPADAVPQIAQALNLSRAEVHGVLSFYHHFKIEPVGRQVVQLCRAEACKSMGADALWQHACAQLQLNDQEALHGANTQDLRYCLQPVYCLGLCSTAPAMAINDRVHGRVKAADFDRLLNITECVA